MTIFNSVGACGSLNGTAPYSKYSIVTRGSKSFMVVTDFMSSACTGTGIVQGNVTIGGTCNTVGVGMFWTVSTATTVTAPTNTQGQLIWTSQATCTVGTTASGLYAAVYQTAPTATQQCATFSNLAFVCPNAFTSTTGGFYVQR